MNEYNNSVFDVAGSTAAMLFASGATNIPNTLIRIVGLREAALFTELNYKRWRLEEQGKLDEDGMFFETVEQISQKLGMKRDEQATLITHLKSAGLLETKVKGLPAKRYFKINTVRLGEMLFNSLVRGDNSISYRQNRELDNVKTASIEQYNKEQDNKEYEDNSVFSKENTTLSSCTELSNETSMPKGMLNPMPSGMLKNDNSFNTNTLKTTNTIKPKKEEKLSCYSFPCVGGAEYVIPQATIDNFSVLYPAVNMDIEIVRIRQWCADNPRKMKTLRGAAKFLSGWMDRAQNRSRNFQANNAMLTPSRQTIVPNPAAKTVPEEKEEPIEDLF